MPDEDGTHTVDVGWYGLGHAVCDIYTRRFGVRFDGEFCHVSTTLPVLEKLVCCGVACWSTDRRPFDYPVRTGRVQSLYLLQSVSESLIEVVPRVVRISVLISVAVYIANVAVAFGLVQKIAGLSRFLTGPANLPDEVGTAILTTTVSTTAGYAMLADLRESGFLDDRATLIAVVMNTFFGFAQHVFTYYIPVLIPILGLYVGILYVASRALIALAISIVGIIAGALLLSEENVDIAAQLDPDELDTEEETVRHRLRSAWDRTRPTLRRLVPRLLVVYTIVTLIVTQYDLTSITGSADPLTTLVGLPAAAVPVIAIYTFDTTAGAATIAPLLGEVFTPKQAVATLLLGGIVSFAVSTFKRSIPFQYGIWGAEFGTKVIVVNTVLKIVFISLTVVTLLAL